MVAAVVGVICLAAGFGIGFAVRGGGESSDAGEKPSVATDRESETTPRASETTDGIGSDVETVAPEDSEEPSPELTNEGDSGGLYFKLENVERKESITYSGDVCSSITPDCEAVTVRAKNDSYYLYLSTLGRNGTKEPLDMTCGYVMEIAVLDTRGAMYTPIEGLDQIEGNPGCNDMTQPGQRFNETFIFLMPEGSEPDTLTWFFVDSDFNEGPQASITLR